MDFLGFNLTNSPECCSDLFGLFASHLRNCSDCSLIFFANFVIFISAFLLIVSIFLFCFSLLYKVIDCKHYKRKYDDLCPDYLAIQEAHQNLRRSYDILEKKYLELQKDYNYTCN